MSAQENNTVTNFHWEKNNNNNSSIAFVNKALKQEQNKTNKKKQKKEKQREIQCRRVRRLYLVVTEEVAFELSPTSSSYPGA